jgi:hypothetical protein
MLELDEAEVQRKVDRVLWRQGVALAVLNGTRVDGLAARVAARLEARNYEVVEVGNASEKTDTTLIIDHRGRTREAQRLAEVLRGGVISVNRDGDNPADITLILGRDMAGGI